MAYNPDVNQGNTSGGVGGSSSGGGGGGGGGNNSGGEDQATKRARRQYAAQRDIQIERALADARTGSVPDILASLGIYDQKEQGRAKYQQYVNFARQYGTGASPQNTYDWTSGQKWDPLYGTQGRTDPNQIQNPNGDDYYRGGWVPINQDEYAGKQKMDDYRSQFGDDFNPWRLDRFKSAQDYGHVTKDPNSGMWYNDPGNDVSKRIWYNNQYQQVDGPGINSSQANYLGPNTTTPYNGPTGTGFVPPGGDLAANGSYYDSLAMAPPAPVQKRGSGFQQAPVQNQVSSLQPNSGWTSMPQTQPQGTTQKPVQQQQTTRPMSIAAPMEPNKGPINPPVSDIGLTNRYGGLRPRKPDGNGWRI